MAQFTLPTKATVERPIAKGYDALIGDLYVRLLTSDTFPTKDETAQPAPEQFSTNVNPEDFSEGPFKTFSRIDFRGGEGLDFAHQRNLSELDTMRYWDSRGIDVSHKDGLMQHITLLHETGQIFDETATNLPLVTDGSSIWWGRSTDVQRSDNPTGSSPTETTEDPHAGQGAVDVLDLAFLGNELYAALGSSAIHKRDSGGTWATWSDFLATRVWGVKGRIIASDGTTLVEAAAAAGSTTLHTLAGGLVWNDVIDAGAAILAAASDGTIYAFEDQSGTLTLVGRTPILGENPTRLASGQGFVFYATEMATEDGGTVARWWRAVLTDSFVLDDARVMRKWGDDETTLDYNPGPMVVTRNHVWMLVQDSASEVHLWRYHFLTGGISRDLEYADGGVPHGLVVVNERMIATIEADGVWQEKSTYVAEGWLMTPLADFYTAKKKQWVGATVWAHALPAGTGIELRYATNPEAIHDNTSSDWILLSTLGAGRVGGEETVIPQTESRWLSAMMVLQADTGKTARPKATAVAVRAYPAIRDVVLELPVNVSDHFERPNRRRMRARGRGEQLWAQIKLMEGTPRLVELLRPQLRVRGLIEKVSTPYTRVSERGSATLVAIVRVRGTKEQVAGGSSPAGSETLGIGSLGIDRLG